MLSLDRRDSRRLSSPVDVAIVRSSIGPTEQLNRLRRTRASCPFSRQCVHPQCQAMWPAAGDVLGAEAAAADPPEDQL